MKTSADIVAEVQWLWDRGHLLVPPPELTFPLRISIPAPTSATIRNQYGEVMAWYEDLESHEAKINRPGYRIVWREAAFRDFGRNRAPDGAVINTVEDALAIINRLADAARYSRLVTSTEQICPALVPWMRSYPLVTLETDWEQVAHVVQWFITNQNASVFRRQIDLPGIDTKFIELRRSLLVKLLDAVLPPHAIHAQYPPRDFDQRYGLRPKPIRVGLRSLDPSLIHFGGLPDVNASVMDLSAISPPVKTVLIVENEITGLAFPPVPGALLIYGLGYGVDVIAGIPWVRDRPVWYWGDIDTHGYAILSRLRGSLPHVRSFLMDEATLLRHKSQCVDEAQQDLGEHRFLTQAESDMLRNLRQGTYGPRVRLEQERISMGWASGIVSTMMTSG